MKFKKIFKILFVIFTVGTAFFIFHFRASHYNYDTSQDYQYNFDRSDSRKVEVQLIDGKLDFPIQFSIDQTIFIKIKVRSTLLGKIVKPSIDITSDQYKITHSFEYGAKGVRYINISNLVIPDDKIISINGNRIHLDDQIIELILFKNTKIDDKTKILFIAPHPDDAEIAAFGLYAKYPQKSYIITITAGEAGNKKYAAIYNKLENHSLKKGKVRTWNSITVPLLSGVPTENCLNLGFFDTTLREMYTDDTISVTSKNIKNSNINLFRKLNLSSLKDSLLGTTNWISLVKNLKLLIKRIDPEIIVTPHPQIDSHPDHLFSTIAVIQALKELKINKGSLLLYANHYSLSDLYPFGKEGDPITLPPYFKDNLYFTSIFSNSLTVSQQKDKLFALDAMNDLRPGLDWRTPLGISKLAAKTILKEVMGIKNTYYKKSVRANELFFVVPINDIELNNILDRTIIR